MYISIKESITFAVKGKETEIYFHVTQGEIKEVTMKI